MTLSQTFDVVVLAAGRSSRMGEPKGLVAFQGHTWIEEQLAAIRRSGGLPVLVLGDDGGRYLQALPTLCSLARLARNPDPARGPFSSLQCGLALVEPRAAAFVLPLDVPAAAPEVWGALRQSLGEGDDAAVPQLDGRGGHPVLLAGATISRLRARPATSRLDVELAGLPRVHRVPVVDPAVRLNLNTPEDWGKFKGGPRGTS